MNTLHPTTKKSLLSFAGKKFQTIFFALAAMFVFVSVPSARASLPPETYYQGIDTGVNGDDLGSGALPIGFNFTFFGNIYSEFYVSSNGYISFENNDLADYTNDDIDDTTNPDNYIAPFWDDLTVYNNSGQYIYYRTIGTAPNRQLVVQYTNVGFWNDPTPLGTFSIILYEGSNNIQLQYRYLIGDSSQTHGASATVGLENDNGKRGTKYSFNTESLSSEQVILFTPSGPNYTIGTAPYEGILLGAGTSASPDIPVQTTPTNGSTVSQTPTFTWEAAANADSYELRIDNNADMGSLELNPTGITETSFTPSSPLPEDNYYWIVIAHNANDSTWSEQWVFTASSTPPLPDTPQLTSPAQAATNVSQSPTFSWQAASGAETYQLILSENSDLSSPLINQSGITTTSYDASGLASDTAYYWAIVASNTTGSSQSSTRDFTTLHINTSPIANDDNETVAEDSGTTSINALANDTDADAGDTLSITSVGTPDNGGTAVLNSGQIDYTPAANFFGTETFTYTISDGNGGSDTATVTVTVTAVNDAPTATDDSETVAEDSSTTTFDVLANDTDPDTGNTLSITAVGATDNGGTAVLNSNQIDYTPALNFFGTETFTYTISDGNGGTDSATVSITVTSVNDTPVAADDSETTTEDSATIQIDVLANDTDADTGDLLSITSVSTPDNGGTAVINANQIDYTPAPNFSGTELFTYTISDGNGGSDTATVTISVTAVNDAPTANDDNETVAEDSGTTTFDVLTNDSDTDTGDTLSITSIGATDNGGTAVINGSQIDYTPASNFFGTETFNYTISDGSGGEDTATVTITVTAVNDAPTASNDNTTVAEDSSTVQTDVLANDNDPDPLDSLSITFVGTPDNGGTAVINSNQIDYTPAHNFSGTETFTYIVSDGNGGIDTATVTIAVTAVNDTPTANDDSESVPEDAGTVQIDVLANDTDPDTGDTVSISGVSTPDNGGTAIINNNQIDYTAAPSFIGTETFTYTISDGNGGSDTATVSITVYVSSSNAAPNANDDLAETLEDASITIDVLENDSDPDGDSLAIINVGSAAHGTVVIQGSAIKYTPDPDFYGSDSFTYTIEDSEFTDTATVYLTVVSVNDLPQAAQDAAATQAGTSIVIKVLDNDSDPIEGSGLIITSVANPAHGTATTNGTTITYTPDAGFTGTEIFTYTLSDGTDSVTGTITVTVNPYQLFIPLVIK